MENITHFASWHHREGYINQFLSLLFLIRTCFTHHNIHCTHFKETSLRGGENVFHTKGIFFIQQYNFRKICCNNKQ